VLAGAVLRPFSCTEGKSLLFLKKKKQKDFCSFAGGAAVIVPATQLMPSK